MSAAASSASTIFISATTLHSTITHRSLIQHLKATLPTSIESPLRHAHQTSPSSSLLLMPSWSLNSSLPYIGVKLVTFHQNNHHLNLPAVHAAYILFNASTGQTLASMDGTELTLYRTSCISALASEFLSKSDSTTLLMVGAGALAPHLIRAHLVIRPSLNRVIIWNRTVEKARKLAQELSSEVQLQGVCFESCENGLDDAVKEADVVVCATCSETPLVKGADLKTGAHLNLVGSFTRSMMECDDEAIRKGNVFVDNEAALVEAGELIGAFERGVIAKDEIKGYLVELIRGEKVGRRDPNEITVFKSVGSADADLLSAQLLYETFVKNQVHG